MTMALSRDGPELAIARPVALGLALALVLACGLIAALRVLTAPVTVAYGGALVAAEGPYWVLPPETARIAMIHVTEGAQLDAGEPVLELDSSEAAASLALAEAQLAEVIARRQRAEAEAAGRAPPPDNGATPGQLGLWSARAAGDDARLAGIAGQLAALESGRRATVAQIADAETLHALAEDRARRLGELAARGAVSRAEADLATAEAAAARGRVDALVAARATTEGQIAMLEAERARAVASRREAAMAELADLRLAETEYRARRDQAAARAARLTLRAPQAGRVTGLGGLAPGVTMPAGFAAIAVEPSDAQRVARFRVAPAHAAMLVPGARVALTVAGRPDIPRAEGRLRAVTQAPASAPDARGLLRVDVDLPPEWPALQVGAGVDAAFPLAVAPLLPVTWSRQAIVAAAQDR